MRFSPATLHDYAYAANNPVIFTDPLGLFTLIDLSAANIIQKTQSTLSVISKTSSLCRIKTFKKLYEAYSAFLQVFPFISFNLTDAIRRIGDPDDAGGLVGTGYNIAWKNPRKNAPTGSLESISAKLGADLTGELKLEAAIQGKNSAAVEFEIVLFPFDKTAESIQGSFGVSRVLVKLTGCGGIKLGTISLGLKQSFKNPNAPTGGATAALRAADAFGFAEIQFDLIKVTDRGTISIGGIPANR